MENTVLSINNLSKRYGRIQAVDNISFEVKKGQVFGILGPNGSGKTTTLGILLDVLKKDSGSFSWFGNEPNHKDRQKIGAILEEPLFYPYLSAYRNLKITADIKGGSDKQIDEVLKTTGLLERKHDKFKTYSFGMRQRLAIAGALLNNPEVLIFDEPTNGLDPQGIAEIRQLITEISQKGITVILASHLLDEVQKVCTDMAVMRKGKILFYGNVEEILSKGLLIEMANSNNEMLLEVLKTLPSIKSVKKEESLLLAKLEENISAQEINKQLSEKGVYLSHLKTRKKSLESYFLELVNDQK
ncbi:MAG: ABC transporter ATP-binding protein [Bacteroidota bacterium]|nr:ABC transporter ATP-binding protein [Bacteroidota bacterium]